MASRVAVLIALVALGTGIAAVDTPPVTLTVTPTVCMAGRTVELRVHVPPHPDNRELCITWDSGASSGDSVLPVRSDQAVYRREIRDTVPGSYYVIVTLRAAGDRSRGRDEGVARCTEWPPRVAGGLSVSEQANAALIVHPAVRLSHRTMIASSRSVNRPSRICVITPSMVTGSPGL